LDGQLTFQKTLSTHAIKWPHGQTHKISIMLKSRPLFLIVLTLCLSLLAVASYWLALLPQRILRDAQADMLNTSALVLDAGKASLDMSNGFAVVLDDVSISSAAGNTFQLSAKTLVLPRWWSNAITLSQAIIDVDVTKGAVGSVTLPQNLIVRDSILKLHNRATKAVFAITDINGTLLPDGSQGAQGRFSMVWASRVASVTFNIEDMLRFGSGGSPADVTLNTKNMFVGFSGQGKFNQGLSLVGQITADAQDTSALLDWFGMSLGNLEGAGAFKMQSAVASKGLAFEFDEIKAQVGTVAMTGNTKIASGPDRARVSGDIAVSRLSLWQGTTIGSVLAKPWSETPLELRDITSLDLDLNLKVDMLRVRDRELGPNVVHLETDGERLKISKDGVNASLTLAKHGGSLSMETSVNVENAEAHTVLGALLNFDALRGPVSVNGTLKAEGQSAAALVSSLQGTLTLASKSTALKGVDLAALLKTPSGGWNLNPDVATQNLKFDASLKILEGVATLMLTDVTIGATLYKPKGEVDLLRQAFALTLAPKLTLTGPWSEPIFSSTITLKDKSSSAN
jgi:AsmA-like C-terminal region